MILFNTQRLVQDEFMKNTSLPSTVQTKQGENTLDTHFHGNWLPCHFSTKQLPEVA